MVSTPQDGRTHARGAERGAARQRSVGEHIFIWMAWALAAAFWGASLTTMVEIFRTAGQPGPEIGAAGAPGGSVYLILVIAAFLAMAGALAWAQFRASTRRSDARVESATMALYNSIERQGREDSARRARDEGRS